MKYIINQRLTQNCERRTIHAEDKVLQSGRSVATAIINCLRTSVYSTGTDLVSPSFSQAAGGECAMQYKMRFNLLTCEE